MGCGCQCGHCPNAFDPRGLEFGEEEVDSPLAARYEREESELERAKHPGFHRTSPAGTQPWRRTKGPAPPSGQAHLRLRTTMGHKPASPSSATGRKQQAHVKLSKLGAPGHPNKLQWKKLGGAGPSQPGAGKRGGPGPARGTFGGGQPRGPGAGVGGAGPAGASNAVILNRRFANQLGWRASFDPIVALLGPVASGGEPAFVQAVAQWQASKGLPANGVLGPESWNLMQADLAASPDAEPLASPPAPLPPGGDAPPDEMEWEFESGRTLSRPASRHWAHCPPSADMPPTERTVLAVISRLETGKPFACTITADDGISMGTIRWNLRDGTLQRLLARFENRSGRLIRFFGADYDRLMGLIALRRSAVQRGRAVVAASAERLADRWRGPLLSLLADTTFYSMLMQDVRGRIAAAKGAARRLGLWTVRGLTLMFDITAREGLGPAKIERFAARLRRLEETRGALSEQEKLVAIADESVRRLTHHRDERRARRMVIATGSGPARGRWWDLDRDYANLDAPWES
jgi:hypothetical protein